MVALLSGAQRSCLTFVVRVTSESLSSIRGPTPVRLGCLDLLRTSQFHAASDPKPGFPKQLATDSHQGACSVCTINFCKI